MEVILGPFAHFIEKSSSMGSHSPFPPIFQAQATICLLCLYLTYSYVHFMYIQSCIQIACCFQGSYTCNMLVLHSFYLFILVWGFLRWISLYNSPSCPGTCCIYQTSSELKTASQALGLKACTTTAFVFLELNDVPHLTMLS